MAPGKLERHDSSLRGSTRPRTHQNQTSIVHLGVFRRRDDQPRGASFFQQSNALGNPSTIDGLTHPTKTEVP